MFNFQELAGRDIKDLRLLAAQYGIKTHHKHKPETIAKLIVEHIQTKPTGQELKHAAEKPAEKEIVMQTPEQVLELIKNYASKPGFEAKFTSSTWWFRCNGSEDSGSLSCAPRVIRMKAESVSKGARRPRMIDLGDGPVMAVG